MIINNIIENEYIPHLVKEVYPSISEEIKNWNERDFTEFLIAFENQVKMKRERLSILELNNTKN